MTHRIAAADVERLSRLSGVSDFNEWTRQLEAQPQRIAAQLKGDIATAWENCLPTWLALGRVCDKSRLIRVPKYWPSYANNLGLAFVEKFWESYSFIVTVLETSPADSHEFLFAFDLLDWIACDTFTDDSAILDALFSLDCPIPPVVELEIAHDTRYSEVKTVGQFLKLSRDL